MQPDIETALRYASTHVGWLRDALAQARGLADTDQQDVATRHFLDGQDGEYASVVATLYYLRSVHVTRLEDAVQQVRDAVVVQQYLTLIAVVLLVGCLAYIGLWLTFHVKRVFIPLLNVALLATLIYGVLLWTTFDSSRKRLDDMSTRYATLAALSDARRELTDASGAQVQWVIGGGTTAGVFTGDAVAEQSFKTTRELLLAVKAGDGSLNTNPSQLPNCSAIRQNNSTFSGSLVDICTALDAPADVTTLDNLIAAYKQWLNADATFRQQVTANQPAQGLATRNAAITAAYAPMITAFDSLNTRVDQAYRTSANDGTDSLNRAGLLAWAVFPLALLLAVAGLILWRRQF